MTDDVMLDTRDAAAFLKMDPRTLEGWRFEGRGPRFHRISGRCVRYSKADLIAWLETKAVQGEGRELETAAAGK